MNKSTMVKVLLVVALVLLAVCLVVAVFGGGNKNDKDNGNGLGDDYEVPGVSHLMYGIKFVGDMKFDREKLLENLYSNPCFDGYKVDEEYCMVYQITNDDEKDEVFEYLGIKEGKLPEIDYTKESFVLSVGRPLEKISSNVNGLSSNNIEVLDVIYTDDEYTEDDVHVYRMNTSKFLSGEALEEYYWENLSSSSNMVLDETKTRNRTAIGTYYRLYEKSNGIYEIEMYANDGITLCRRFIADYPMKVTEYKSSLIKIDYGSGNKYYNTEKNVFSEDYSFNTEYLIYNLIRYMRVRNGEIQMIIRDAYDTYLYGKIVRLPFTNDTGDLDSLVKSVSVVDDTHISVEYYTGDDRKLVKEIVEVYNLDR